MKVSFGGNYLLTFPQDKRNEAYGKIRKEHSENCKSQNEQLKMEKIDSDKVLLLTGNDRDEFYQADAACRAAGCLGTQDSILKAFAEKALKIDLTKVHWGNFDEF